MLRDLFEQQAGRAEGNQLDMLTLDCTERDCVQPQIVKPSVYQPRLLRTALFQRVHALARCLLGADAQFSFDHSILKPAGKVAATPWHQDEAHSHDAHFHHEQISFWMPLQDVGEENGCMRYIPGSNRGPLLPHRSFADDPRIHALECVPGSFDESAAVACPVRAGWGILHAGRTLHSALPNRTGTDRLAYVLVFRAPPVPRSEPARFTWLATKRTASLERSQRWRSRGGFMVLLGRWLQRTLSSDRRTLQIKVQKLLQLGRAALRQGWRAAGRREPRPG
jgi:ectoine hydroxylase-related dioxygenase (phytanoyl-CoA dioxygenase family)